MNTTNSFFFYQGAQLVKKKKNPKFNNNQIPPFPGFALFFFFHISDGNTEDLTFLSSVFTWQLPSIMWDIAW